MVHKMVHRAGVGPKNGKSTLPCFVSCNCFFEACSAFTHVMACTLAESLNDPLHRKLRQLRCLRCRFDCYRVERTSSRAGVTPAEVQRLFTTHSFANNLWRDMMKSAAWLNIETEQN